MAEEGNTRSDRRSDKNKPPYFLYGIILIIGLWGMSKGIWKLIGVLETQNNTQQAIVQTKESINKLTERVNLILEDNVLYNKNYKAFNFREESKVCASCHLKPNMYLLRSNLPLTDFTAYVRGTKRHIKNNTMPSFTKEMISDHTLENIWLILRHE